MAAGTLQLVTICSASAGTVSTSGRPVACGTDASGNTLYLSTIQAYVLSPESAGYIDSIVQPFDYTAAAGFWGLAFTTIITLWLVSHGSGAIVNFLRRS
ncbi:hypothetical protein PXJ20_00500 [Paraburkholderia sp. A1RI_3L]|uniref:hypothetical protein n=1 Tax=Paraburkholderia TaxID=1822464 RepID=UPI003B7AA8B6